MYMLYKEYKYALPYKIGMIIISLLAIAIAIFAGIDFYKEDNIRDLVFYCPAVLLVGILGIPHAYLRTIIVTDTYLGKRNFFHQTNLPYEEIEILRVVELEMWVIGNGKKIHITKDLEDYKYIMKLSASPKMHH